MRQDKAINIFLFFFLQATLFVCFFPIYFSYDKINLRTVSLPERMLSLIFVMLWLALCVYSSWKKRMPLFIGGVLYSLLAYIPGWVLPHLIIEPGSFREQGLIAGLLQTFFEKIYELVNAPMAGVSLLVSEKASTSLSRWLLPVLVISYAGVHLFRFYHNAYLAEQLHLEENAYFSNPALARELAATPGAAVIYSMPSPAEPVSRDPAKSKAERPAKPKAAPRTDAKLPAAAASGTAQDDTDSDDNEQTRLRVPILPK